MQSLLTVQPKASDYRGARKDLAEVNNYFAELGRFAARTLSKIYRSSMPLLICALRSGAESVDKKIDNRQLIA